MVKFLSEKVLPDRDHQQTDENRAADQHLDEDQTLLISTEFAQVDGREPCDGHRRHADEERVDIFNRILSVAGVEDTGHD